ncbi:hypothetical protein GBAR_LOCUS19466 [Geodia barretti]|uniref:Uncharacterized protein n=1 Tax=Geodia barretti TaxID=519541 RepID=A0AA35X1K1_GEOBA|nr:hypothetical protein GBAR_LOCUS19466 [Geodia barretti]
MEGDRPLTFAFTTCTPQSLAYAAGYKSLSPISYIASNKPLKEEVEVLLEHSVNIESIEQAGDMVFCHANLPEDGSSKIQFSPLQGGKFEVGKPRGRLKTNELGFFVVATKAAKTPPTRYAVMCCYSNKDGDTKHVGLSISVANEVYMTNFRDALQEAWNTSVSEISKVPVVFQDSNARVSLPRNRKGWKITADTQHCEFFKGDIDFEGRDSFSKKHYPPRSTFIIIASRKAKLCSQIFSVTGLDRDVNFQILLNPTKSNLSHEDIEKPTLVSLNQLGDIRIIEESASEYYQIGIMLLNDRHGDQLAEIEHNNRTQTAKMTGIYRRWLKQGASWATLCDCLQRCHLEDLADRIKNHFGIVSPSALPVSSLSDSETAQNGSTNQVANGMPESNDNEIAVSSGETSHNPEANERTPLIPPHPDGKCCQCCTVQ